MKRNGINYALHILDTQFENMVSRPTAEREAYYDGMRLMFDILISNGYETNAIVHNENGKHSVLWEVR